MKTIYEKKALSTLVRRDRLSKKRLHLLPTKRRVFSLVIFILVAVYSILTKFVITPVGPRFISFSDFTDSGNWMLLFTLVHIACGLALKIWGNSILAINHIVAFRRLGFAESLSKLLIFVLGGVAILQSLDTICVENTAYSGFFSYLSARGKGEVDSLIMLGGSFNWGYFVKIATLLVSIAATIPAVFFIIKNYGLLFLIFLNGMIGLPVYLYLRSRTLVLYELDASNSSYVIRSIYKMKTVWWHILIIMVVEIAFIVGVVFLIIYLFRRSHGLA